jgi:hypothetical protein
VFAPLNAPTRDNTGVNEIQRNEINATVLLEQKLFYVLEFGVSA